MFYFSDPRRAPLPVDRLNPVGTEFPGPARLPFCAVSRALELALQGFLQRSLTVLDCCRFQGGI